MNQQKTVWIIDDTREDLYIAELLFKKTNPDFVIKSFQLPEVALKQLILLHQQNQLLPDAIILDLNMPVISGFEFLDSTAGFGSQHPPVFILTSSADENDKRHAEQYEPVKYFFTKPFSRQMVQQISKALLCSFLYCSII